MTYEEITAGLRALTAADFDEDIPDRRGPQQLDQLMNALRNVPSADRAIPDLFAVMERLPDSFLGSPGPLVHALERMDYTGELLASLRRRPTIYTLWMVNRILNSSLSPEDRQFYLDVLSSIASHSNADAETRDEARRYLELER